MCVGGGMCVCVRVHVHILPSTSACKDNGVECLVYTSTYNVIFGGQVIENGDESLPYLPQHKVRMYHQKQCEGACV